MILFIKNNKLHVKGSKLKLSFSLPKHDFFITFPNGLYIKGIFHRKAQKCKYTLEEYTSSFYYNPSVPVRRIKRKNISECLDLQYDPPRVWLDYSENGPTDKQMVESLKSFTDWKKLPFCSLYKVFEEVRLHFPEY